MKCPACGQWNRASFPKCFKCGMPLPFDERRSAVLPAEEMENTHPLSAADIPVRYDVDAEGNETPSEDPKDRLAREMQSYHDRKRRGKIRQQVMREEGAKKGYAPTGASVSSRARKNNMFDQAQKGYDPYAVQPGERVDYDGYTTTPSYQRTSDGYSETAGIGRGNSGAIPLPPRRMRPQPIFGLKRFLPLVSILLVASALGLSAWYFILQPYVFAEKTVPEELKPQISASIMNEVAAHTIRIPAKEGTQIYIKELRKSYLVTGGYATFQVPDYMWYELHEEIADDPSTRLPPTMDVTLTPFVRSETGEQVPMDPVNYTIDIQLSPLTLLSPDTTYVETSMPLFNIRFQVMTNSQVFINDEDFSSYVNTQDGLISYNAPIQPIGDNRIHIMVRSQYYRMNTVTLTINRAVQDIPLDLAATMDDESGRDRMPIFGTTRAGATITVLTPHEKLDVSEVGSTGRFNFNAIFEKYGVNTIRIQADYPGKNTTIIEYNVTYLPGPNDYTTRAWAIADGWGYGDLLANLATRVANTQVYVMTGPVTQIIAAKPQLVMLDASDGKNATPLNVMLENQSKTTWELGRRYTIYADAYGLYNSVPRLVARYTYTPKAPK